jgi:hypothetical protein
MPAPAGNQFWKARSTHGRKPIFSSPEQLLAACEEYFQWVDDHPLEEVKGFAFQGNVTKENFPKMRAMTVAGLCIFLDISPNTWFDYAKQDGFSEVCNTVMNVIREQKFAGAAADLLNPAIIARDLGLADKSEITGKDGAPLVPEVNEGEIARRIAFALAKAGRE